ncbi:MFS transporter, partial [Paramuribaculum intestinale]|uniref:MFS transporter n=1 Tax=Paramuribaculum intestinale TaxID=2094151 RepID=UPI00272A1C5E
MSEATKQPSVDDFAGAFELQIAPETDILTEAEHPRLWNGNYVRVWVANFMLFFAFYLLTPLLPIFLWDTFRADSAVTGIVLSGYTVTALIARPFSGYIVDSFPRKT